MFDLIRVQPSFLFFFFTALKISFARLAVESVEKSHLGQAVPGSTSGQTGSKRVSSLLYGTLLNHLFGKEKKTECAQESLNSL